MILTRIEASCFGEAIGGNLIASALAGSVRDAARRLQSRIRFDPFGWQPMRSIPHSGASLYHSVALYDTDVSSRYGGEGSGRLERPSGSEADAYSDRFVMGEL